MSARFVPRKIVGELVGAWVDEQGETIREVAVGGIAFYPPDFPRVEQLVAEVWPAAIAAQAERAPDTIPAPAGDTRNGNRQQGASSRAKRPKAAARKR